MIIPKRQPVTRHEEAAVFSVSAGTGMVFVRQHDLKHTRLS